MPDLLFLRVPGAQAGTNRLHLGLRPDGPGHVGAQAAEAATDELCVLGTFRPGEHDE